MPFLVGPNPITRTQSYLDGGKIFLKSRIKIFTVHYSPNASGHEGATEFVQLHLPQIQYKNPDVQCNTFKFMLPSPFIRCYLENGDDIVVDLDSKKRKDILWHVITVLGKPRHIIEQEQIAKEQKENPANFGYLCRNKCICDFLGQVPCPSLVPVPKHIRGKNRKTLGRYPYEPFYTF